MALKYKVGDRVKIKSLDWYNENKDEFDEVPCKGYTFVKSMALYCDSILTIVKKIEDCYYWMKDIPFYWTDEMIEGLEEEENNHLTETVVDAVRKSNDRYRIVLDPRFDIEVDEGEYYAVRRRKEYPKTYEECINELDIHEVVATCAWEKEIKALQRLLVCRDTYWKIAGEEMGLGKPWEPDWTNQKSLKYCIANVGGQIKTSERYIVNTILAFPIEEIRNAFYENFKELIESCKELL